MLAGRQAGHTFRLKVHILSRLILDCLNSKKKKCNSEQIIQVCLSLDSGCLNAVSEWHLLNLQEIRCLAADTFAKNWQSIVTLAVNTPELYQFSVWVLCQPKCHKWYSATVVYNLTKLTYFYLKWRSQGIQTLHRKRYLIVAVTVGHYSVLRWTFSLPSSLVQIHYLSMFYRFTFIDSLAHQNIHA